MFVAILFDFQHFCFAYIIGWILLSNGEILRPDLFEIEIVDNELEPFGDKMFSLYAAMHYGHSLFVCDEQYQNI